MGLTPKGPALMLYAIDEALTKQPVYIVHRLFPSNLIDARFTPNEVCLLCGAVAPQMQPFTRNRSLAEGQTNTSVTYLFGIRFSRPYNRIQDVQKPLSCEGQL